MIRREFVAGLGGAVAWPLAARGQQGERVRRVGFLLPRDDQTQRNGFETLRGELAKLGWVEGRNLRIDLRFGGADADHFRSYAAELINLAPDVLVTVTGAMTIAAQRQTQAIPIIFWRSVTRLRAASSRTSLVPRAIRPASPICSTRSREMGGAAEGSRPWHRICRLRLQRSSRCSPSRAEALPRLK
jgi:hypothetical protein